ncbi:MAG: SMI1/KNR4 family protein [Nocardioidaceae bacterium]
MASEWSRLYGDETLTTRPGADSAAVAHAGERLGRHLPAGLAELYAESDGVFDELGQWWIIWPLDMLVQENTARWAVGVLPTRLLAFGDDGTGDAFGLEGDQPDIVCWHPIDDASVHLAPDLHTFWDRWVSGDLET